MSKRKQLNQAFKKKYLHNTIHQSGDQFGRVQVVDDGRIRSLHFDSVEKQSSMDLEKPEYLVLSYTRYMMVGFLFNPGARKILCIGLGGGSIPRFLSYYKNDCEVDVVEIRQLVIDVARDYFFLPVDQRFRYFKEDGAAFVNRPDLKSYDAILVDAYDHQGISEAVLDFTFLESCVSLLSEQGAFCINLWSHPPARYKEAMQTIKSIFGKKVFEIPVSDRTNRIVLGLKPGWQRPSLPLLKRRADILEDGLKLPFSEILKTLMKYNKSQFKAIQAII